MNKAKLTENILLFLAKNQKDDGEFASYEKYSPPHPLSEEGWVYTSPSPFIHSNILYCLLGCEDEKAKTIMNKGVFFLTKVKEPYDCWRYWKHESPNFNIPLDVDDTALASFVMESNGITLDNKKILLRNTNKEDRILTWIISQNSQLRNPLLWNYLRKDIKKTSPEVWEYGMLSLDDTEPSVTANVLLYLNESTSTHKIIKKLINDLSDNKNFPLYFYDDKLITYYHVARAFHNGVKELKDLKEMILKYTKGRINKVKDDFFKNILCLTIFKYFGTNEGVVEDLEHYLITTVSEPNFKWEAYPYFYSKNRIFSGGSPELTASFFLKSIRI